jgi:hypothetical protein
LTQQGRQASEIVSLEVGEFQELGELLVGRIQLMLELINPMTCVLQLFLPPYALNADPRRQTEDLIGTAQEKLL